MHPDAMLEKYTPHASQRPYGSGLILAQRNAFVSDLIIRLILQHVRKQLLNACGQIFLVQMRARLAHVTQSSSIQHIAEPCEVGGVPADTKVGDSEL